MLLTSAYLNAISLIANNCNIQRTHIFLAVCTDCSFFTQLCITFTLPMLQLRPHVIPPEVHVSGHAKTQKMATTSHVTDVTCTSRAATGGCTTIGHVRRDSCGTTTRRGAAGNLTLASVLVSYRRHRATYT